MCVSMLFVEVATTGACVLIVAEEQAWTGISSSQQQQHEKWAQTDGVFAVPGPVVGAAAAGVAATVGAVCPPRKGGAYLQMPCRRWLGA